MIRISHRSHFQTTITTTTTNKRDYCLLIMIIGVRHHTSHMSNHQVDLVLWLSDRQCFTLIKFNIRTLFVFRHFSKSTFQNNVKTSVCENDTHRFTCLAGFVRRWQHCTSDCVMWNTADSLWIKHWNPEQTCFLTYHSRHTTFPQKQEQYMRGSEPSYYYVFIYFSLPKFSWWNNRCSFFPAHQLFCFFHFIFIVHLYWCCHIRFISVCYKALKASKILS